MSLYEIPKPSKNKAETKRRLILAVGEIVKEEGFSGLKISTIAKKAEVDRKLIYRYFGGLNYLIESYVVENDYWMLFADNMKKMIQESKFTSSEQLITAVLQNQFKFFFTEKDMQRLILWELSADSPLMRSIHNVRETMGQKFLELTDLHFKDSTVNFRAVAALLVGGIYYTVLHTKFIGGNFTDLDIATEDGQTEILKAIEQIVAWAYKQAEIEK
jgi:AcrR family transcriptional regulator